MRRPPITIRGPRRRAAPSSQPSGRWPSGRSLMSKQEFSRRTFLGAAAASPLVLSALGGPARAADITIGIIYVGSRQDYGWNQAHAVAAKALKDVPGVK